MQMRHVVRLKIVLSRCDRMDRFLRFVGVSAALNLIPTEGNTRRIITSQYRRIKFQNPRNILLPVIIHGNYH